MAKTVQKVANVKMKASATLQMVPAPAHPGIMENSAMKHALKDATALDATSIAIVITSRILSIISSLATSWEMAQRLPTKINFYIFALLSLIFYLVSSREMALRSHRKTNFTFLH